MKLIVATCQRKSLRVFFRNSRRNNQENLDQLRIISKASKAPYRELSRLDSRMQFLIYKINQIFRHFMTFLKSKYGWLILHEIIGQKKLIRTLHQPPLREILHKIPCVAENHGKNGLLSTDLLVRHIRQSFAGESGNV